MHEVIHLIDDDELARASLSYTLTKSGYATQIYSSGAEFFSSVNLTNGCILLDLRMPGMSGHEVQEELARRGNTLPVIVMSAWCEPPGVVLAMRLGAVDVIEKSASETDLLEAVEQALASAGRNRVRRNVKLAAVERLNRLSRREREILQGLLDGLSNKGIARRLGISARTVEMHRARMNSDLGVKSLSEALRFAIDAGLIPIGTEERPAETDPDAWLGTHAGGGGRRA